jgi:uncharacterized protein
MIWAAFMLGLAGSVHCAGMCGPLLLAVPMDAATRRRVLLDWGIYHSGRIAMYACLGGLLGITGQGLALLGGQQMLSLVSGVLMLGMALWWWRIEQWMSSVGWFRALTDRIKNRMGRLLRQHSGSSLFGLGVLNGLLPCGMVYTALAGAISTTHAWGGAVFMALFGLGTLPLLVGVIMAGQSVKNRLRGRLRWVQPILLLIAGWMLIQRGWNIDLSVLESAVPPAQIDCH